MAGGRKKSRLVFWVIFLVIVAIAAKPAWESVSFVFGKIGSSITSPLGIALSSLIIFVIGFAGLFAVVTLLAAIPAQFVRTALDTGFRIRLNDIFVALISMLKQSEESQPHNTQLHQLRIDTEDLHTKYISTKTNRLLSWIVPNYFKKDTSKWKLVSVENKNTKKGK